MKPETIKRLIELVQESEIDVLEVSSWGRKVKITRKQMAVNGSAPVATHQVVVPEAVIASAPAPAVAPQAASAESGAAVPSSNANWVEIKSPMIGTYYSSPSPESPVFAKVGDSVSEGTVVCIVEAMKLMNEIESEVSGKIVKALIENGQPVEFGQALFLVDINA